MVEITRTLAADIRRQFFFVITSTASTHRLVQNFQLIKYLPFGASKWHVTIQRQW